MENPLKGKLFLIGSVLFLSGSFILFVYFASRLPEPSNQKILKEITLLPDEEPVKTKAEKKQILLYKAVKEGDLKTVFEFLKEGVNTNIKDKNFGWTPLHWAAGQGNLQVISALLEQEADVNAQDNNLWTPLHEAVSNGDLKTASFLLERGADVNAQDSNLWTPLHEAVSNSDLKIASVLLEWGADVNKKDKNYWSSLELAQMDGNTKGLRLLSKYNFSLKLKMLILCVLLAITGTLIFSAIRVGFSEKSE